MLILVLDFIAAARNRRVGPPAQSGLPDEFEGELNFARGSRRPDTPKGRRSRTVIRIVASAGRVGAAQVRPVEQIEELRTELHRERLFQFEILESREISDPLTRLSRFNRFRSTKAWPETVCLVLAFQSMRASPMSPWRG